MTEHLIGVGIGIFLILISYYFHRIKRGETNNSPKPPEAEGGWPLIGHLGLLGGSTQPPHIALGALADKYGPIFTVRFGLHPAVVVSSWELAKHSFTALDPILSSRPKFTAAKILGYDYANFGFSPSGPFWREMRKITASELFSASRFESLRSIRDSEARSSVKELYRAWEEKRGESDEELLVVEMKQWLGEMNLNVILRMVAGQRCSNSNRSEDEQLGRRIRTVLREWFRLMGLFVLGDAIPWLGWLDFGGEVKQMKKTAIELDRIMCEWLEQHRQKRDSPDANAEQDFFHLLLSVLDGVDLAGYDFDTVVKATISMVIAGAVDTTCVSMIWALSLLLNNSDALKKVQDELDEHVGRERLVNDSDIKKLVFLEAVVKETMRLYPAGTLSGPREFTEDCTLGGYHIKKGTRFILNLWKLHRDPRVWSDPLEFRPERFLTTHKGVDVKGQHFELLPFGGGRRMCPGISFGLQMTLLALASFLQAFQVMTPSSAQVDMSATFGLTNIKTTPLEVLVKPRLSHQRLFEDEDEGTGNVSH